MSEIPEVPARAPVKTPSVKTPSGKTPSVVEIRAGAERLRAECVAVHAERGHLTDILEGRFWAPISGYVKAERRLRAYVVQHYEVLEDLGWAREVYTAYQADCQRPDRRPAPHLGEGPGRFRSEDVGDPGL